MVARPAPTAAARANAADGDAGGRAARFAHVVLPAACMLAIAFWDITRSSYWRDEAATLSAVRRSLPGLLHMLGHTDVVHGSYYLLLWPVVHTLGAGELATRLPSALAAAAAAGGIGAIGRRVADRRVGLAAGLVFAVLPVSSEFAQQARSYAVVMALAVAASYLLVRALDSAGPRWSWWTGYGVALAAMGWLHIMSLTIVLAHGLTLWLWRPRPGRDIAAAWLAAAAAAAVAVSPLGLMAWQQRHGTQRFLHTTTFLTVGGFPARLTGSWLAVAAIAPLAVIGFRAAPGSRLVRLCLPWMLLPGGLMIVTGIWSPVYDPRYILFCVPALALLCGAGVVTFAQNAGHWWRLLAAIRPGVRFAAAVLAAALLSLPSQLMYRAPGGHGDDIRLAARIVADHASPGDAVLYQPKWWRQVAAAYPYGFAELRDVALDVTPNQAGDFTGTQFGVAQVRRKLAGVPRVWLVEFQVFRPSPYLGRNWRIVGQWRADTLLLTLYQRRL